MKERLVRRVSRLISGGFNSLVDAIENTAPETVMAEAIREIDTAIDDVRAELGRAVASRHLASNRLMAENNRHQDLSEKAELAVSQGRDDLAEAAIARQIDIEAQLPVLETAVADWSAQEKELEGYIQALAAKKRQMAEDLRQYQKSREQEKMTAADAPAAASSENDAGIDNRVRKAEAAFERIMSQASGLPASSGTGTDRENATRLAELESMAHQHRVRERLAAVKNKMSSGK